MTGLTAAALTVGLLFGTQLETRQGAGRTADAPTAGRRSTEARRSTSTSEAIQELKSTVEVLQAELSSIRRELAQQKARSIAAADLQRLTLLEEREARLELRLTAARDRLHDAQDRQQLVQQRLDNITTERIQYGGLNREDSERQVRNYLERELARAQNDEIAAQRDVARIEEELEATRRAVDAMRRKLNLTAADIEEEIEEAEADEGVELVPEPPEVVEEPEDETTLRPIPNEAGGPPR